MDLDDSGAFDLESDSEFALGAAEAAAEEAFSSCSTGQGLLSVACRSQATEVGTHFDLGTDACSL